MSRPHHLKSARGTRVICSRFNGEIVTARDLSLDCGSNLPAKRGRKSQNITPSIDQKSVKTFPNPQNSYIRIQRVNTYKTSLLSMNKKRA